MGAVPTALLVGLAAPGDLAVDWALDLVRGLVAECERGRAAIAGGDVTSADTVMLGITALGDLEGRPPVTRAGARPGDLLAVAGRPGRSAAGLALLAAGRAGDQLPAELADLVTAHRRPQPPYEAGPLAARLGATAMIDISDGLVQDVGHVAAASGVSIDIDPARLPDPGPLRAAAGTLGADWLDWALTGGEDHALVATFPPGTSLPARLDGHRGRGPGIGRSREFPAASRYRRLESFSLIQSDTPKIVVDGLHALAEPAFRLI